MWLRDVSVTVNTLHATDGRVVRSRAFTKTSLGYCLDDHHRRTLAIGEEQKLIQEYAVAGGVKMHTKFASNGKATLQLVKSHVMLLIKTANPRELQSWLRALQSGGRPSAASDDLAKRPLGQRSMSSANAGSSPSGCSPAGLPKKKSRERTPGGGYGGAYSSSRLSSPPSRPSPKLSPASQRRLTVEQQRVLRDVLGGKSIFFTGGAGTGKSFLLKEILRRLPAASTFATATTGVAACAIGGGTLHHWAGIGGGERPVADLAAGALRKRGNQWRAAKTLIIDEISMLDGALFDTLERVARIVRGSEKAFGGLQLVLCGDFFQLPPVVKNGALVKFAFEASGWDACVDTTHELTQVFRQSDPEFVTALNELRLGRCAPSVRELLMGCKGRILDDGDGIIATQLFTHKNDCARVNKAQLEMLDGKRNTYEARDSADTEDGRAALRTGSMAPEVLTLKIGAQVVLIKTLDAAQGLVNGARGVVVRFMNGGGAPEVRFDGGATMTIRHEPFTISQAGRVVATRSQLPLDYGWAISIHKSQGMSLSRVAVSLGKCFEHGQMYVALSRARSLEGLSLIDIDFSRLKAHPAVLRFHEEVLGHAIRPCPL